MSKDNTKNVQGNYEYCIDAKEFFRIQSDLFSKKAETGELLDKLYSKNFKCKIYSDNPDYYVQFARFVKDNYKFTKHLLMLCNYFEPKSFVIIYSPNAKPFLITNENQNLIIEIPVSK